MHIHSHDEAGGVQADKIRQLCIAADSVSSKYAADPSKAPGELAKQLYSTHHLELSPKPAPEVRKPLSPEDLEWARSCGKFEGTQPSELFLGAYHDLLQCLEDDPLASCVSPSLCGSTGYMPMTIIAPLNDQMRHMSNLIVRAKKEVLLATNFWKKSGASTFITDALKEASKRAGERGDKLICKLMFDRGDIKQFMDNHQVVTAEARQSSGVGLPSPEEIPNVDLAVVNFHKPPIGTFHCKFMVVDRQIACISSNNIQDNDNLEMMSHVEGPIVDSLWDTFLISWHKTLDPPVPCREETSASRPAPTLQEPSFMGLFQPDGSFREPEKPATANLPEHMPHEPHYDRDLADEVERMRSVLQPTEGESHADAVCRHLNKPTSLDIKATAPAREPNLHFFPFIPVPSTDPVPIAMCSRKPYSALNNKSVFVPQNEAWLSLIRNAKQSIFIQTPDLNAKPLLPELISAAKRGIDVTYYVCLGYNDTGELLPGQGGTNEMAAHGLYAALEPNERQNLKVFFYVAADQDHPIHNSFRQRSCHIKLLIADARVAVQGSGNQDTQSWFHSQEVNVMIDSPLVCAAWREGIERNQNTALFGRAREDGCWYDKDHKLAAGSYGSSPGAFSWAKGIVGTFNKARGV